MADKDEIWKKMIEENLDKIIELLPFIVEKVPNKYGPGDVYQNMVMDKLRGYQCLCLNCKEMNDCPGAKSNFENCKEYGMAFPVTRCGVKDEDGNLMYKMKE
jgi:hypothetical protein